MVAVIGITAAVIWTAKACMRGGVSIITAARKLLRAAESG